MISRWHVGGSLTTDTQRLSREPGFGSAMLARLLRPGPHVTYIIFLLIIAFFVIVAPNFASWRTAGAVGRITAVVTIMAVGMTFVVVCGEIDLSVGSHVSFAAMVVRGAALPRRARLARGTGGPAARCRRRCDQRAPGHRAATCLPSRHARHAERAARAGAQLHGLDAGADRRYRLRPGAGRQRSPWRACADLVDLGDRAGRVLPAAHSLFGRRASLPAATARRPVSRASTRTGYGSQRSPFPA